MRSVFVPWSVALNEGERLLDDLSRYTEVDCVELLDFLSQIERPDHGPSKRLGSRVLPSSRGLELDLPLVEKKEFMAARRFTESARSRGFKVACNTVPLWLGTEKHPGSSLVDANGRRVPGPGDMPLYACPNDPDTKRYGEYIVGELVRTWQDMDILELNHLEYPHILLWAYPRVDLESMFACFCKNCEGKARELGIDFAAMRKEAVSLIKLLSSPASGGKGRELSVNGDDVINFLIGRPRLAEWLQFRMDSVTEYALSLVATARAAAKEHNPKLTLAMQFQLPSLSRTLGTDFVALASKLDLMVPKFFDYLPSSVIPLIAKEIGSRTGLDQRILRGAIRDAFDLGPDPEKYVKTKAYPKLSHTILYSNTFDYSVFGRQMRFLEPIRSKVAIAPGILECNRDKAGLKKKIEGLAAQGFKDFFLWSWEEGLTTEHLRSLKGVL